MLVCLRLVKWLFILVLIPTLSSYGHKPSGWIVPSKGHFPDGGEKVEGTFVVGPMARNVADLQAVFDVLAKEKFSKLRPVKVQQKNHDWPAFNYFDLFFARVAYFQK
jgi:Asp-tRNA(Asn)/Glu-tRNA(Gln) amidotransferase A subunit family amidase